MFELWEYDDKGDYAGTHPAQYLTRKEAEAALKELKPHLGKGHYYVLEGPRARW